MDENGAITDEYVPRSVVFLLEEGCVQGCSVFVIVVNRVGLFQTLHSTHNIHATNVTQVPSIHYIVDAVECLKEAYAVYSEPVDKAKLYSELFQEKHNESEWNVAVGYTAVHIKSKWYVETTVSEGGKNKDKKDKKDKDTKFLIFSKV